MDGRELARTPAVRDFALAVGEWLLARRFGYITPLAFSYYMWEAYGGYDIPPHVVINLLVNDPPPPSPEWLALSVEERARRPFSEWARAGLWPLEDIHALKDGAGEYARAIGFPDMIDEILPVQVALFAQTDAGEMKMRFPHVAGEAARAR